VRNDDEQKEDIGDRQTDHEGESREPCGPTGQHREDHYAISGYAEEKHDAVGDGLRQEMRFLCPRRAQLVNILVVIVAAIRVRVRVEGLGVRTGVHRALQRLGVRHVYKFVESINVCISAC